MKPHIQAAFVALRRHKVPVTYTNIYLMKTVNLILCGEAIGDETAARDGYAQLDTWIEHTRQAGIGEFDSPNYYAVNLNSLLMGHRFAARPEAREKFRRLLDLFWSDIAANYFPGRGTLSGPHSRGYEFLRGHESVELFLYTEGLRQTPPSVEPSIGRQFLLLSEIAGGYRPPAGVLRLASLPERIVESRYRAEPHRDRYNYVTPDFAAGSASGHYGTHDKLINIELANQRDLPVIYVAPDAIDHPYGKLKSKDRSGHLKPVHAPLNAASVQHKGALLTLLDLDPSALAETGSFATNVVVPAGADALVLDGKPVKVSKASLFHAADQALQLLPTSPPIYLLGESLGSGVAAYLGGTQPDKIAGMILLSPYDRLANVAQHRLPFLPARLMLLDRFPSEDYLHSYHGPIGIMIDGRDFVVPPVFGQRLYDGYTGPKRLWEFFPAALISPSWNRDCSFGAKSWISG